MLHEIYHYNLAIVIILLNLPLVIISFFTVGKTFAIRTLVAVVLLGISLWLLPTIQLTSDKLLISIFGGAFLGLGVGLVMRSGAALDGIEVLAIYTLRKTSFTMSEIILGLNIMIFATAAIYLSVETALYSVLTYFCATRTIDYIIEGIQAFTGVTIISGQNEEIKHQLVHKFGRGITIYKGERGYLPDNFDQKMDCDIIFTVISRMEMRKLLNVVQNLDPNAFIIANTIREASGGILSRKSHH